MDHLSSLYICPVVRDFLFSDTAIDTIITVSLISYITEKRRMGFSTSYRVQVSTLGLLKYFETTYKSSGCYRSLLVIVVTTTDIFKIIVNTL